jgi:hypothetical protein
MDQNGTSLPATWIPAGTHAGPVSGSRRQVPSVKVYTHYYYPENIDLKKYLVNLKRLLYI